MTNEELDNTIKNIKEAIKYPELFENVSTSERWLSGAAGTYLLIKGISSMFAHPIMGLSGAAVGAGLLYRGIVGYCPLKDIKAQRESSMPEEIVVTETYVVEDIA